MKKILLLLPMLLMGIGPSPGFIHTWVGISPKESPYNCKFDGVTDDTAGLRACFSAAISLKSDVTLPKGNCFLSGPVTLSSGLKMVGQGMANTTFILGSNTAGFVSNPTLYLSQVVLDSFGVTGNAYTGNAFDFSNTTSQVYECNFSNLQIISGNHAFYNPTEFNNSYKNLQMSSWNGNAFEVGGGNTCSYKNLYVHNVPTNFFGYRVYGGGLFEACNGIDTGGGSWGCIGQRTADGDFTNSQYQCVFNKCNFEAWSQYGLWLRYTGTAIFNDCSFIPANNVTYVCSVYATDTSDIEFHGGNFYGCSGCTRQKLSEVACGSCSGPIISYGNTGVSQVDEAGYAQTLQTITASNPAFITHSLLINYLSTLGLWVTGNAAVTGTVSASSYFSGPTPTPGFTGPITFLKSIVATPSVMQVNGGIITVSTPAPNN